MARYRSTIDIYTLNDDQRAKLQPGQWIGNGSTEPTGRWMGMGRAGTAIAAWRGNARQAKGGPRAYYRAIRDYALSQKEAANT